MVDVFGVGLPAKSSEQFLDFRRFLFGGDFAGLEIIRRIREWTTAPVIVLSARDREGSKLKALDLSANDMCASPSGLRT